MSNDSTATDRYRSFKGIDFDDQASRMIGRITLHTQGCEGPFWAYFFQRRNATADRRYDDQLLRLQPEPRVAGSQG